MHPASSVPFLSTGGSRSAAAFRSLNQDIETIINKSEHVKAAKKQGEKELSKKEKKELSQEEKEFKSMRKQIQEKLIKFATRVPVFMYLTDYRERTLRDVITQLEPGLFKKMTGLGVKDFELLCSEEAKIAFRIAFERGQYAGFQNFFRPDVEPLTFEHFVLDKLLTVPEMKQFPDYYEARMKVNELETELADQLDPFSREHLTSITYAWEERTTAILRYGFALGYQKAVDIIGQVEPESAGRMAAAWWKVKRETL